ncbi:ell-associated factor Eaf [Tribolium castaneum]|uniref:Ell-associated factor Eaf n=1 Tax=Tribolium castaneum TaxID=7070 RepID=D2A431_TRICA|nr:PREDICTED: ell-associated factor Eaf [Tribolium castaneum]XP_015836614.1 PREDICTED: ell-associated factor Eaf [Tribolium castaneum]XP_967672.1 PREDICTED: ell-associated factor Eaf [Tribolium castaneum]EFA05606.1 Ell-associated factor Eaf-like Protein [Tribolium castaneum]|eukprot:XP_008194996.1 PREDICTED: ell-associated factor Eaf [Tribolium castaneum]
MAEKLGLGSEVRQLKIGQSFTNPKSSAFHSIKYDFKPASVDTNKIATVDVGNNNQVTVTVPHLDGAGVPQTVFKGSQRPYQKECVLIIDRATGEITLEKLTCNIQVKKTRSESAKQPLPQATDRSGTTSMRSQTPPIGQRISHKTKVTSGSRRPDRPITHLVPKHSPLHASPSYPSPKSHANETHQSTLASLPMIGIDDFDAPPPPSSTDKSPSMFPLSDHETAGVGEMSDSSSSSSDSDSDSDNPDLTAVNKLSKTNGHSNGTSAATKISTHLLNEDLCLSESGSDSD